MSINTFCLGVRTYGYQTAATATAFVQNIDPIVGGRLGVVAFGLTCAGGAAQKAYFMVPLGRTTVPLGATSGIYTCVFAGDPGVVAPANLFASGDNVCIKLSDGTYQWGTAANWWVSNYTCVLTSVLTAAVNANAPVWNFGLYTDAGHFQYALTVSAQSTKDLAGLPIFATPAIYDPMKLYMLNPGTQIQTIDYLTVAAMNI